MYKPTNKRVLVLAGMIVAILSTMSIIGPSEILDAKLYYSGEEAISLLNKFDKSEMHKYQIVALLDLFLIAIYSYTFKVSLQILYPNKKKFILLGFLPGAFDYIETLGVLCVLNNGYCISILQWLGFITLIKWILVIVIILILIFGYQKLKFSNQVSKV